MDVSVYVEIKEEIRTELRGLLRLPVSLVNKIATQITVVLTC